MSFKKIAIDEIKLNPMTMIGKKWWLITAGNEKSGYNTMTASWGHLGAIWERAGNLPHLGLPTAIVYVRPQRYTKEFIDRENIFTLSVFDEEYRKSLLYLGTHSGKNENKIEKTKLTPVFTENTTYFKEAELVFICRKLYHAPLLESGFLDKGLVERNYKEKDFHEMYVGEILEVLVKE